MGSLDQQVRKFRRRVVGATALAFGIRLAALWLLLWGTTVAALRAGFDVPRGVLLWGLAGAIPVVAVALFLGWRRRPSRRSVLSLLDLHAAGGGLMMTAGEADLGEWRTAVGEARAPKVRGHGPWRPLLACGAFVVAAFLMPVAPVGLEVERPLEIGEEIAELGARIEILQEEGLLQEEVADRLTAELESLEEQATGEDPAATWEALDHLQETTDREIAAVAEAALSEGERLAAAEALAEALSSEPDDTLALTAGEAMAELAALSAQAAQESQLLDRALAAELGSAAEASAAVSGSPDRGDMTQLLEALGQGKEQVGEKLDKLYSSGMIDLETLLESKRALEGGDTEQLSSYLQERGLEAASSFCRGGDQMPGDGSESRAGRGGVSRGSSDAPMSWKDPSSPDGVKWREQVLDPTSLAALEQSRLLGLTVADPESLEQAVPGSSGAVDSATTAGGGAAYTHTVLPRHRGVVRRYFDRAVSSPTGASNRTGEVNR